MTSEVTFPEMEVLSDLPEAAIGRYNDQVLLLVRDSSRAGWRVIRSALADLGFDLSKTTMSQQGWWADGVELWTITAD